MNNPPRSNRDDLRPDQHDPATFAGGPGTSAAPVGAGAGERRTLPSTPCETRTIRGYRLLQTLGGGAYGVVYRALSPGGVEVAIKEIRYLATQQESIRELEALKLITKLHHPYLLSLHDFWTDNNQLYIAMELAESSLAEMARDFGQAGIPSDVLMPIFAEAAEALDFLHDNKVLHRDIKPANILLLRGHAKVADLGLAKHNPGNAAQSQTVAGTPAFMAPETFMNQLRAESDQYALALCYAELRLGRQICLANSFLEAMVWHAESNPNIEGVLPFERGPLLRALSKKPEERFSNCRAFVEAMRPPEPEPIELLLPPPKRSRWTLILAAALGALPLAALLAWLILRPRMDWDPEAHGFRKHPDATVVRIGGQRLYDRITKDMGDFPADFVLIAKELPDDPPTFYMMETKVSNGQFKFVAGYPDAAQGQPAYTELVARLQAEYPVVTAWREWTLGGEIEVTENGEKRFKSLGCADDRLPVFRVNVLEAHAFARWVHPTLAELPTDRQWLAAAGFGRAQTPFRGERSALRLGDEFDYPDVAVNRPRRGPVPIGSAPFDVTVRNCRDMAGNGVEWTSSLSLSSEAFPPKPGPENLSLFMVARGQSYMIGSEPFEFDKPPASRYFSKPRPDVGFRVAVSLN